MPVIAIIGAGPGMGLAIRQDVWHARVQGRARVAPSAKLGPLVRELGTRGIDASTFQVNALDRASVAGGLASAKQRSGSIDVLEFSPADPSLPMASPSQVTHENAQVPIDFYVHGPWLHDPTVGAGAGGCDP